LREPWAAVRSAVVCRNRAPCDPFPLRSPWVPRSTKTNHPLAMGHRFGHGAWSSGDASCPSSSAHRGCTGYSAAPPAACKPCLSAHRLIGNGPRGNGAVLLSAACCARAHFWPLPRLHQDWGRPCTRTGARPCRICMRDWGSPLPHLHQDWARPCPHLYRDWARYSSPLV
jgi:hypothetical protein